MLQPLKVRRSAAQARGLTLIELLIVVVVTATLIGLAAPAFKRMIDMQRLRSINAALITDLQFARSEAASRNQEVLVRFDNTGGSLTCYVILVGSHSNCNCKNTPGSNICTGVQTREIRTVQVDRATGIVVQIPSGQAERTVAFDPATGRISVYALDVPMPPTAPFKVEVKFPGLGGFVNVLEATGRPTVCSPAGEISGVPACS